MVARYYNFGDDSDSYFFADATSRAVMWLGRSFWGQYDTYFDGMIDDVRIYDRPLSSEEAGELYRRGIEVITGSSKVR